MKRSASLVLFAAALLVLVGVAAHAAPMNATGHWQVQVTGINGPSGISNSTVTLNQIGTTIIGHGTGGMTTINGSMVSDTKMNATWNGPKGAGWLTVYFSADGKSFDGEWGYNGAKPSGKFIGQLIVPPTPTPAPPKITAAGSWNIALASGQGLGTGVMQLHQAGAAVVGTWAKATIDGKMVAAEKFAGGWKGPQGSGWLSLWLDKDGKSLHGLWGFNGKQTSGRFVGHRVEAQ